MVSRNPSPVQGESTNANSMVSRTDLLSSDTARPCPADPREESQNRKEITRKCIIGKACSQEHKEKFHPCQSFVFGLFLMERPEQIQKKKKNLIVTENKDNH